MGVWGRCAQNQKQCVKYTRTQHFNYKKNQKKIFWGTVNPLQNSLLRLYPCGLWSPDRSPTFLKRGCIYGCPPGLPSTKSGCLSGPADDTFRIPMCLWMCWRNCGMVAAKICRFSTPLLPIHHYRTTTDWWGSRSAAWLKELMTSVMSLIEYRYIPVLRHQVNAGL